LYPPHLAGLSGTHGVAPHSGLLTAYAPGVPRLKSTPEDFLVEELPLYTPSGSGEHTWVEVEKRLRTTEEVAGALAAAAAVDPGRVGWAGRKDREAVTRQWLSVPGLPPARAATLAGDGWHVLRAVAHGERLRLGELIGNHFRLVVRDVAAGDAAAAAARLADISLHGLPNRFGAQRFGDDGRNVERGAALLRGETAPGGRRQQRLYLSALQAAIFNEALRRRPAPPRQLLPGDLALVHASGALLPVGGPTMPGNAIEQLQSRADRFDLSPTGPLLGHKMRAPRGEPLERERAAAASCGAPWVPTLPRLRGHLLPGGRRPLRVPVTEVSHHHRRESLELAFVLPPGSYATVLVEELFATDPTAAEGPQPSLP
jgi:tRNA pseudouridine13 synthase